MALSFDDALVHHIGQFGKSQIFTFSLASLIWVPNAVFILLMVFSGQDPIKARWWRCTDSADTACQQAYESADSLAFCDLPKNAWEWTDRGRSAVAQFDLVCGRSFLTSLANAAFFLGYLIGSGVFGYLSDAGGRKRSLFGACFMASFFTIMTGFSTSYWMYFFSRILVGIGAAGQALITYVIATESIGPSWRGICGVVTQMMFVVGEFVLVLLAYIFKPWRALCFAAVVLGASVLGMYPFITESPRWLLVKGRKAEAEAILTKMAQVNGTRMPTEPLQDATQGTEQHMGLGAVLRDRHICRRFVVLAYAWCVLCMTYYGISLALNGLKGSVYVTFMIAAAMEFPSNALAAWLIEKIGRHNSMAAGLMLGGASCLICSFCPPGAGQAAFAAIGKFGCAGAFTIASIYTSELFPTLVRSAVLGAENEAARVGGIAAPFIVLLGTTSGSSAMPFLVFGCTSVVAALLIFTLPETLGAPMPDNMQDMDAIKSIFTTGAWRDGWAATCRGMFATRAYSRVKEGQKGDLQQISVTADSVASSGPALSTASHSSATDGSSCEGDGTVVVVCTSAACSPVKARG